MADEVDADRKELLEARRRIGEQLWQVENPVRSLDRNPQLAARLRAMLAEINECLGEAGPDDA
jgi:hypothetical protein